VGKEQLHVANQRRQRHGPLSVGGLISC
jgi:hypothetical protein